MKTKTLLAITILSILLLSNCTSVKYIKIETKESAQITMPRNIRNILVVNNVVKQPDNIGHTVKKIGEKNIHESSVSADSVAIFYMEAMTQFLNEEQFFNNVKFYNKPLRNDNDFWQDKPLLPEQMLKLQCETNADAIISLDKMILQTNWQEVFERENYNYVVMTAKIQSSIRLYLPSMDGKIFLSQLVDSLKWEGYDIRDGRAMDEFIVPTQKDGLKNIAIYAAEKMTKVFAPHWDIQDRWYYTSLDAKMQEGEVFANTFEWNEALAKWLDYYNSKSTDLKKARVASNIALAYEMLDDIDSAWEWVNISHELFLKSTSDGSYDRRRSLFFKKELQRRKENADKFKEHDGL